MTDTGADPEATPNAEADRTREQSGDDDTRHRQTPGDGVTVGDPAVGRGLLEGEMGPSSALAHLYRGEVHRMKFWRERLDRTTNWAVLLLAAVLTWAFSNPSNPHYVLLLGNLAVGLFLVIEARRYRAYDAWRSRVRTLQRNVFAVGLEPSREPTSGWRERLAADYHQPALRISVEEALAHRLRRVYLPLFAIVSGAWVLRVTAFGPARWPGSAAVGAVPGVVVTGAVVVVLFVATVVALRPRSWRAHDELRTEDIRPPRE